MRLTILGSGTELPDKHRSSPSYLLEVDKFTILVDCGSGTIKKFLEIGYDYNKVDCILITHTHADHVSDLFPLLQAIYIKTLLKQNFEREKPIYIIGPKNFKNNYNTLKKILFPEKEFYPVVVQELNNDIFLLNDIKIQAKQVKHVDYLNSNSYRIEKGRKTVSFSGDSGVCTNLLNNIKNSDLCIIDSSVAIGVRSKINMHLNPGQAGYIAQKAGVKKLVLSHLFNFNSCIDITRECKMRFKGEVVIAEDLMEINV